MAWLNQVSVQSNVAIAPVDGLLLLKGVLVEVLLQLLIRVVDAQLLKYEHRANSTYNKNRHTQETIQRHRCCLTLEPGTDSRGALIYERISPSNMC